MPTNNKKIIFAVIAIVLVIAGIGGTVITMSILNKKEPAVTTKKVNADALQKQAKEAIKNNDDAKAKTLLEEANKQYKEEGNTTKVVDTDTQLYLLNHPTPQQTGPVIPPSEPPSASK